MQVSVQAQHSVICCTQYLQQHYQIISVAEMYYTVLTWFEHLACELQIPV